MRILKKALPLWGAFFVALGLPVAARCLPAQVQAPVSVQVAKVVDGDTVRLVDGRAIRLIGINAPEAAKEGRPGEPGAKQATRRLKVLLQGVDLRLSLGAESRDHYGRWLGHLWDGDKLLAEQLLLEGLVYQISIPPNLIYYDCLKQAELMAVKQQLGLWRISPWLEVEHLLADAAGFKLLQGRVSGLRKIRSGWIVELDQRLAIRLSSSQSAVLMPEHWLHRTIRVRGWLRPRQPRAPKHFMPWFINLSHPSHLQVFP